MPRVNSFLLYNLYRWAHFRIVTLIGRKGISAGRHGLLGRRSHIQIRQRGRITIGERFVTDDDVLLGANGELNVGHGVFVNARSRIVAHERIDIGDNVVIATGVSIVDHDHQTEIVDHALIIRKDRFITSPIRIGNNVWLGDKVTVLKGVTIGDNVIIGANAVVTKDIDSGAVVGGIPASVIRTLDLG
jgi:acetyltransferase-like isoleucine patch superfamily enzyme